MCYCEWNCLITKLGNILFSNIWRISLALVLSYTECGCFSDPFHGSQMQCPLQQCQLHHCPFNEVISRHMGADVAKKTHCDVIVIDAHHPPYPLHNLVDGIRITTCIMWRQLSPWRLGSHCIGSRLISGRGGEAN